MFTSCCRWGVQSHMATSIATYQAIFHFHPKWKWKKRIPWKKLIQSNWNMEMSCLHTNKTTESRNSVDMQYISLSVCMKEKHLDEVYVFMYSVCGKSVYLFNIWDDICYLLISNLNFVYRHPKKSIRKIIQFYPRWKRLRYVSLPYPDSAAVTFIETAILSFAHYYTAKIEYTLSINRRPTTFFYSTTITTFAGQIPRTTTKTKKNNKKYAAYLNVK